MYLIAYGDPQYAIGGRKCGLQGNQYWPNVPFIGREMDRMHIFSDGFSGMIAVWGDYAPSVVKISRIYANGGLGGDTTSINEEQTPIPGRISLLQNYPNPFNGSTTIIFRASDNRPALLDIFNVLGQRVKSNPINVVDGGKGAFLLDLGDCPSGIYFAILKVEGEESNTIKMIMVR
jgi:hypothetical protein